LLEITAKIYCKYLYLPEGIKIKYRGNLKWSGRQGRLEIIYEEVAEYE